MGCHPAGDDHNAPWRTATKISLMPHCNWKHRDRRVLQDGPLYHRALEAPQRGLHRCAVAPSPTRRKALHCTAAPWIRRGVRRSIAPPRLGATAAQGAPLRRCAVGHRGVRRSIAPLRRGPPWRRARRCAVAPWDVEAKNSERCRKWRNGAMAQLAPLGSSGATAQRRKLYHGLPMAQRRKGAGCPNGFPWRHGATAQRRRDVWAQECRGARVQRRNPHHLPREAAQIPPTLILPNLTSPPTSVGRRQPT